MSMGRIMGMVLLALAACHSPPEPDDDLAYCRRVCSPLPPRSVVHELGGGTCTCDWDLDMAETYDGGARLKGCPAFCAPNLVKSQTTSPFNVDCECFH